MEHFNLRRDEIAALQRVVPFCRAGRGTLQNMALSCSAEGWNDLLIYFWQRLGRCVAELELKIRELGGEIGPDVPEQNILGADPENKPANPLTVDKQLIIRAVDHLAQLLNRYAEARRISLSFDVRMLLQRHQLQCQEILDRLSSIHFGCDKRQDQKENFNMNITINQERPMIRLPDVKTGDTVTVQSANRTK